MKKTIKISVLELLVVAVMLIISKFVEFEAFSFCTGAIYVMILDLVGKLVKE